MNVNCRFWSTFWWRNRKTSWLCKVFIGKTRILSLVLNQMLAAGLRGWSVFVARCKTCTTRYMSSPARAQQRISTAIMRDRMRNCFAVKVIPFSFVICKLTSRGWHNIFWTWSTSHWSIGFERPNVLVRSCGLPMFRSSCSPNWRSVDFEKVLRFVCSWATWLLKTRCLRSGVNVSKIRPDHIRACSSKCSE